MTQQHVDAGVLKRIGVIPTPWPCFVFVVREDNISKRAKEVKKIIETINQSCTEFTKGGEHSNSLKYIQDSYKLSQADAEEFMNTVTYDCTTNISTTMLQEVISTLYDLNLMPPEGQSGKISPKDVISPTIARPAMVSSKL